MRVPESLEAARELLNFGLKGANLETLIAIGEKDDGKFVADETDDDWDSLDQANLNLRQVRTPYDFQAPSSRENYQISDIKF